VVVTGTLAGSDGRKMSKLFGNYTDPNVLMDEYSADALRFLLMSSPLMNGEDFALKDKDVADVNRKLAMVWNMYDFFTLYADVDDWEWDGGLDDPSSEVTNPLDQWVVSRVHQLTQEVDTHMQGYDIPNAIKPLLDFIEDASNWYVRRSRKRFWKSGDTTDKTNAYRTLHYVLVRLSMVIAPFTPFLAEELYQKLTGGESVHLLDWPSTGHINEIILDEMAVVRELISVGLSQRAEAGIKVRQPLAGAQVTLPFSVTDPDRAELGAIMTEELNVKSLQCEVGSAPSITMDTKLNDELRAEGVMRDIVRQVQNMRKAAELQVDDRIALYVDAESALAKKALERFKDVIMQETLATSWLTEAPDEAKTLKIDGSSVAIGLQKQG
jgi:isoleucyl-tRNA synthetase